MNNNITSLYSAVIDNRVVCIDTNLKDFHNAFEKICTDCRNYQWFYRQFQAADYFEWNGYHFQKLV
ncbi:hypothetical protein [Winogradskyella sp.]|uniref:hypothetical protein n=1 Tax=Winogradskyella sp. TaxID=1883156 RepID=UPI003BAB473B